MRTGFDSAEPELQIRASSNVEFKRSMHLTQIKSLFRAAVLAAFSLAAAAGQTQDISGNRMLNGSFRFRHLAVQVVDANSQSDGHHGGLRNHRVRRRGELYDHRQPRWTTALRAARHSP